MKTIKKGLDKKNQVIQKLKGLSYTIRMTQKNHLMYI